MIERFTAKHVETWRRDGALVIADFFTADEVAAVVADFEQVFGRPSDHAEALVRRREDGVGGFHPAQFKTSELIPFDCSPALNLLALHPALIAFAQAALGCEDVHLYQGLAWAKFTGAADYEQPFHCDYLNHTLVAPSEDERRNTVTIMCYLTDVSEAHGPTHYVVKPDSDPIAGPEETLGPPDRQAALHRKLAPFTKSTAALAGAIFPYGIDVYHRGTNLTAPGGHRYTLTACFKRRGDDTFGFHAWPLHHLKPWARIFDHASPDQLACLGVHPPGHPFWTAVTLARAQARYPKWDLAPYRQGLAAAASARHE